MKEGIDRWTSALEFDSRTVVMKTNILLRLIYLSQSLPVPITDDQLREWDEVISRFIWNGKAPRVGHKALQLPRQSGGMGLPSLQDYCQATQIKPLTLWCIQEHAAKWKTVALSLVDRPLQSSQNKTTPTASGLGFL